jgi:hypothetical protein
MKKSLVLKATLLSLVASSSLLADSLAQSFKNSEVGGYVRAGYQNHDGNVDNFALGGKLSLKTAPFYGLSTGASFYTTHGFGFGNDATDGIPYFGSDNESYSILGEAYLEYKAMNTTLKFGRQEIDTPYANSDDIGMIPNTFEAYLLINQSLPDTTVIAGYVDKWAGVDGSLEDFTKLNGDKGVKVISAIYSGVPNLSLQAWYYNLEDLVDLTYFEAGYEKEFGGVSLSLAGQFATQDYDSLNADADTIGLSANGSFENFGVNLAYNSTDGKVGAINGFGGGPFFTSAEHLTIDGVINAEAFLVGAEVTLMDRLTMGANYITFEGDDFEANELDLTLSYAVSEELSLDVIHSDIEDKKDDSESFTNSRVFVNYSF